MHRLKELRKHHHLSQKEVAEALHLDQATYSRLENSDRCLMSDVVIGLAKLYHISCDAVLGYRCENRQDTAREFLNLLLLTLSELEEQEKFGYITQRHDRRKR